MNFSSNVRLPNETQINFPGNPNLCVGMFEKFNGTIYFPTNFNTSNVTSMKNLFKGSNADPNLSNWDVSNLEDASGMFRDTENANPDVFRWSTSNIVKANYMFAGAKKADPNIEKWNVHSLKEAKGMFKDAVKANPNPCIWNTLNLEDASEMFMGTKTNPLNLYSWNVTKLKKADRMFKNSTAGDFYSINSWNLEELESCDEMFAGCENLQLYLTNWNTPSLKSAKNMFKDAVISLFVISKIPGSDNPNTAEANACKNDFQWPSKYAHPKDPSHFTVIEVDSGYWFKSFIGCYNSSHPFTFNDENKILMAAPYIEEPYAARSIYCEKLFDKYKPQLRVSINPPDLPIEYYAIDITNQTTKKTTRHRIYESSTYTFRHKSAKQQGYYTYDLLGVIKDKKTGLEATTKPGIASDGLIATRQQKYSVYIKDGKLRIKIPYSKATSKATHFYITRKRHGSNEEKYVARLKNTGKTRYYTDKYTYNANKYQYCVWPEYPHKGSGLLFGWSRRKTKTFFYSPKVYSRKPSKGKGVRISWKRPKKATGFDVYRWNPSKKKYVLIKKLGKNSYYYYDRKAKSGRKHSYKVRAKRHFKAGTIYSPKSKSTSCKAK